MNLQTSTGVQGTTRRTDEQKLAWLEQQLARTKAALAQKARKRRAHALITLGATVILMRDAALNERILAAIVVKRDRDLVAELLEREGGP